MASGRAYSKSGSIQKYESSQWSTPTWSSSSAKGTVSTPDSDGNYTVSAPSGYRENSNGGAVTCTTKYGGVAKMFYFVPNTTTNINIYFNITLINYRSNSIPSYIKAELAFTANPLPRDILITVGIKDPSIYGEYISYFNFVFNAGETSSGQQKPTGIYSSGSSMPTLTNALAEPSSYMGSDGTRYNFSTTTSTQTN